MNWDDMRFFLALSREGSISAAGRSLGVNHTTVARRIAALEDVLGTRLFDRLPDGYEMTQSAENLYRHALEIEAHTQAINREVFGQDAALKGPLKLTVSHDVANRLLIRDLRSFRNEYPCIDLEILTTTGLVDLASRQADIAVRLTAKPPDYLVGREVLPMRHGIYGSQKYLEEMNGSVDAVLFRGDNEYPEWIKEHFPEPASVMRTDDITTMLTAVREHHGLARMPCYIGDSDPDIRRLDVRLSPSTWGIWILSHVDLRSTARVRVCRDFLVAAIEKKRDLVLGENSNYFRQ
jgi:DNA-binding transcriptional LysR family regulator